MIASEHGYHETELRNALDPKKRTSLLPAIESRHEFVLDVGCGMGQSLIAAQLPATVSASGIDPDATLIAYGKTIVPSNVRLEVGSAENLPFGDEHFDLIYSRVALPYTHLSQALGEISRTLKPGGDVWLVLHTANMYTRRLRRSAMRRQFKDVAYCCFILCNGLLLHALGMQLRIRGRLETFQTTSGMRRALRRAGLEWIRSESSGKPTLFVICARKSA